MKRKKTTIFKYITPKDVAQSLACFNGETINPKGILIIIVKLGGWKIQAAPFINVDEEKATIKSRNILPQIGIKLIQENQNEVKC